MGKAKNETQAKVTLEKFETIVLARATKGLPFEGLILASPFSSRQEMTELEGLALQRARQARKQAIIEEQALIREERALLVSMGLSAQERQVHLSELVSRKDKSTEEKTSPSLNRENPMVFWNMVSKWHNEVYKKPCPKNWGFELKESELTTGTRAVLFILWQAFQGKEQAQKLLQNQTNLNIMVRKLSGKNEYNNPNSGKVFGNFLKWIESN